MIDCSWALRITWPVNPYSRIHNPPASAISSVRRSPRKEAAATAESAGSRSMTPARASACAATACANPDLQGTGPPSKGKSYSQ